MKQHPAPRSPVSVVAESLTTAALGDHRALGPAGETTLSTVIAAGAYRVVLATEEAIRRLRTPLP